MPLEQQLLALAQCGVTLNPPVTVDEFFIFHSREVREAAPFKELIPNLGFEMERGLVRSQREISELVIVGATSIVSKSADAVSGRRHSSLLLKLSAKEKEIRIP